MKTDVATMRAIVQDQYGEPGDVLRIEEIARPGIAVVRGGTLDRSNELKVVAHIWTKRKMDGIVIPEGVPSWSEGAPPADFIAALSR